MAFKVSDYGNGELGDVSNVSETINSYARVTAISGSTVTINADTQTEGAATFKVGAKVLLHVSASVAGEKEFLGNWLLANITDIREDVLSLSENAEACVPSEDLASYYVQLIAVAQYKNLTLESGTIITPPIYSAASFYGGIVALMCSETLKFNGGHIALTDRGIPTASKALRPLTSQSDVASSTDNYSGQENSDTHNHFLLNSGDGAAFIVAKTMICHEDSRIGNVSSRGCQFYRGGTNAITYGDTAPSSVTNVGGSTILIAAETIENFGHHMLAKYRASGSAAGQGICRCYIASNTKLRNDEGLYAYDCISTPKRVTESMNIKNFGNGSFGDAVNLTSQINNYATATAIDGSKVTYKNKTTTGSAQIQSGALVMIHYTQKGTTNVEDAGRFIIAKVLSDNGSVLTLDTAPPNISVTDYACQIVSIPQCNNFTLSGTNSATPVFNGAQGGIFAIVVKNNCDLSDGIIKVYGKGSSAAAYGREGLAVIGNAQDCDKLPIGKGHGSIFILAQKLTVNSSTRLGYKSSDGGGGARGDFAYRGLTEFKSYGTLVYTQSGSGANGGVSGKINGTSVPNAGGYGSNGSAPKFEPSGNSYYRDRVYQGAHVMIIANTITNFDLACLATGGGISANVGKGEFGNAGSIKPPGEKSTYGTYPRGGYNGGGAGYENMYSGGSAGWVFIYCNNAVNQNLTGAYRAN